MVLSHKKYLRLHTMGKELFSSYHYHAKTLLRLFVLSASMCNGFSSNTCIQKLKKVKTNTNAVTMYLKYLVKPSG
jgi:hypothetical protein